MDRYEVAAAVLEPHFDAVRDAFVRHRPAPGSDLTKLRRTKFEVDPSVHDGGRHYAACRDDGLLIKLAPQMVFLPHERVVAIITHEFGHAADFAYPSYWVTPMRGDTPAVWIGDVETRQSRKWRSLWSARSDDQVEWAADSIALAVTGQEIRYCGQCMIQCFSGKRSRPAGLR